MAPAAFHVRRAYSAEVATKAGSGFAQVRAFFEPSLIPLGGVSCKSCRIMISIPKVNQPKVEKFAIFEQGM